MEKTEDLFGRIKSDEQAEMMVTVMYAYDELKTLKQNLSDKEIYDQVMSLKSCWKKIKNLKCLIRYSIWQCFLLFQSNTPVYCQIRL